MDVIEASHMEVIKQYLIKNPDRQFKARKLSSHWTLSIQDYDGSVIHMATGDSFGVTVGNISAWIREQKL